EAFLAGGGALALEADRDVVAVAAVEPQGQRVVQGDRVGHGAADDHAGAVLVEERHAVGARLVEVVEQGRRGQGHRTRRRRGALGGRVGPGGAGGRAVLL